MFASQKSQKVLSVPVVLPAVGKVQRHHSKTRTLHEPEHVLGSAPFPKLSLSLFGRALPCSGKHYKNENSHFLNSIPKVKFN